VRSVTTDNPTGLKLTLTFWSLQAGDNTVPLEVEVGQTYLPVNTTSFAEQPGGEQLLGVRLAKV